MTIWREARGELRGMPDGRGLNIAYEAVDRHVAHGFGDRVAYRFIDRQGHASSLCYADLSTQSDRFARVLWDLGMQPGDLVCALTGRIPELYVAALGTLKMRGVFSALFSHFGPEPLRARLNKGRARILLTTEALYGRRIAALREQLPDLAHVIVLETAPEGTLHYASLMAATPAAWHIPDTAPDDPALIHFTSGTTGSPKAALHVHEAVLAHYVTGRHVLGLQPGDVYWCTADPGWVTGISYGLSAPLACGVTSIIDDREFDPVRWYQVIESYRVNVWYTAPTALRLLMQAGTAAAHAFDLSSLRRIASVGEPLNPEVVRWGREAFDRDIYDTWWQTETGAIMIAAPADEPVVPGCMGRPLSGIEAAIVRREAEGRVVRLDGPAEGEIALRAGWPSMFRAYLGEPERYARCFVGALYLSGDRARRDGEGRYWFVSRCDEVIKSAGHLIGAFEVESALLEHPAIAEAAVIGKPTPLIGEMVKAFVTLRSGHHADETTRRSVTAFARKRLGPVLAPREIDFVASLPKTRSGKIMRRLLLARDLGMPEGDISSLATSEGGDDSA